MNIRIIIRMRRITIASIARATPRQVTRREMTRATATRTSAAAAYVVTHGFWGRGLASYLLKFCKEHH